MSPDLFDRPQHFRSLLLKLPQQAHSKAHMIGQELRLVLAHQLKELVLSCAGPELPQDIVLTHSAMMNQSVRGTAQGPEPEHDRSRPGTGQASSLLFILHSSALQLRQGAHQDWTLALIVYHGFKERNFNKKVSCSR